MAGLTQLIGGLGKIAGGYQRKQFAKGEEQAGKRGYKKQMRAFRRGQFDKKISAEKKKELDLATRLGAESLKNVQETGKTAQEQLIANIGRGADTRAFGAMAQQQQGITAANREAEKQAALDISKAQGDFADYASGVQADNEGTQQGLEAMQLARDATQMDAGKLLGQKARQEMISGGTEAAAGGASMMMAEKGGRLKTLLSMVRGDKGMKVGRDMSDPRVSARVEDLEEMKEGRKRRREDKKFYKEGDVSRKARRFFSQQNVLEERAERKARNEKRKEESDRKNKELGEKYNKQDKKEKDEDTSENTSADTKKDEDDITKMLALYQNPTSKFAERMSRNSVFGGESAEKGGYVGKEGGVTEGEFSHEENPIDMVNEEGDKVGEVTGGEYVLNDDQSATIKDLVESNKPKQLINFMRDLLSQPQFK